MLFCLFPLVQRPSVLQVFFPYSGFSHPCIDCEVRGESTFAKGVSSLGEDMTLGESLFPVLTLQNDKVSLNRPKCLAHNKKILLDPVGEQPHSCPGAKLILFLQGDLTIHSLFTFGQTLLQHKKGFITFYY